LTRPSLKAWSTHSIGHRLPFSEATTSNILAPPSSAATATLRKSITSIYRRWPGVIAGFNVGSSRPQNDGYMRIRPPSPTFIQAAGRATHPKKFGRQLGVIDNHLVVSSSASRASCPRRWSPSPHQTNDDLVQAHSPFCLRVVLRRGRRSGHTNERAHKPNLPPPAEGSPTVLVAGHAQNTRTIAAGQESTAKILPSSLGPEG